MAQIFFIVSCEHASRRIPRAYQQWISPSEAQGHTAFDIGAQEYAEVLAQALNALFFTATISRLLIDCNRSLHHPKLFGQALRDAPTPLKQQLIDQYYVPYRQQVTAAIAKARRQRRPVIHLAAHSFTPELKGVTRCADIGLLYDPQRQSESHCAMRWQAALKASVPSLRIRRNYPYLGSSDGFTTALRKCHDDADYLGFEIEINQALLSSSSRAVREFRTWFASVAHEALVAANTDLFGNK